jgi:hypothetical protein
MRFKNRENQLMWERYTDPYSTLPQFDDQQPSDPTVEDPYLMDGEEESEMVVEFEPMTGLETEEQSYNEVVYSDVKKLAEYSKRLLDICKEKELEPWMQAKLIKASDYVSEIWHRIDAEADFANTGFEQSDNIEL